MSRWGGGLPRFTGHPWSNVLGAQLDDLLRRFFQFQSIAQKDPAAATEIQAGVAASGGTTLTAEPLAKDDHIHSIETGIPQHPTGTVASEGTGTAIMRADATIQQGIVAVKGDLLGFSTVPEAVAVGSNNYVLTADSSAAPGVSWQPPSGASRAFALFLSE